MQDFIGARSNDNVLGCLWLAWRVVGPRALAVNLPRLHCTDMRGAILIATHLMADVEVIQTFAGTVEDTVYVLTENGWVAK